ncbi:MAG: hypothetical protein JWN04_3056 [Myxococcaceae bacterium]|nr:hypothetical protein [Myxococcaceae bacterium]
MHASAQAAWQRFITQDEGDIPYMYLDTKMLVTVGIGNLIDPVSQALTLPFQFKASNAAGVPPGRAATRQEIEAEWLALKHHPNKRALAQNGARGCARLTSLELSAANRQHLFERVTNRHEAQLVTYFPELAQWPADAQIGLMAMAWGLGMYFPPHWPRFSADCRNQDFDGAARKCRISTWRAERNERSERLFTNAARVVANPSAYARSQVHYPVTLLDTVEITP